MVAADVGTPCSTCSPINFMTPFLWILLVLNAALFVAGWRLHRHATRAAAEGAEAVIEVAEASRHLRDLEARERWAALDLDRLHPINRDEVVGLLQRIEGGSLRGLSTQERAFLDRMVEAEHRVRRAASMPDMGRSPRPQGT